ncbi:TPA: hypothetical protein KPK07_002433 [Clostridioides difficile]|nr:hypothetical protein [Clostridioides difficile]MBY2552337.1 hypothetical protein [Clostridioides difficile]HBG2262605.1 hypothetical protein [Clostridioides difficile]HBG2462765.1 hypothetical protein [Clostridioides difficile]HDN2505481.1 hypothetical protein [Clostridioides difficile]
MECKSLFLVLSLNLNTCFRLTIWNVNFATYDGEMITLTGFILTMWT